jgi:nitrogen fixation NifU-like protein
MKIDQKIRDEKFNFLQDHSRNFLEMAYRTDKIERIENPDGYGKRTGVCGDTIEMFLMFKNDKIETASFHAQGCINTVACSNTVVTMAEGKTIEEAWNITPEKVTDFLETLPSKETHCAELAVGAFYLALADLSDIINSSWKKLYKK